MTIREVDDNDIQCTVCRRGTHRAHIHHATCNTTGPLRQKTDLLMTIMMMSGATRGVDTHAMAEREPIMEVWKWSPSVVQRQSPW